MSAPWKPVISFVNSKDAENDNFIQSYGQTGYMYVLNGDIFKTLSHSYCVNVFLFGLHRREVNLITLERVMLSR